LTPSLPFSDRGGTRRYGQVTAGTKAPQVAEEIASLTASLLHGGYLAIEPGSGRLELSAQGERANNALVEAGRAVLTRLAADIDPPEEQVADTLRRLAISLLAEIPRDATRQPPAPTASAEALAG
jgi:hypothetical protein